MATPPRSRRDPLVLIALGIVATWMARSFQEVGHGWGDDFALYVNQARGLSDGTLWGVVADNRFGLANSAWDYYSPIVYPWLFPLLLMPFVAVGGIDYSLLKWVPTLSFTVAVLCVLVIARRRLNRPATVLVTALVALNPWYLSATDAVLSDLVFLAAVLAAIVMLDRAVVHQRVVTDTLGPMVGAALLIAAAFHIRREALGLSLALAMAQLMAHRSSPQRATRRSIVTPWVWLIGAALGFHLVLPSPLLATNAPGGGLAALKHHIPWYRLPLAELIGLKEIGDQPVSGWGSTILGNIVFWAIIVGALIGIAAGLADVVARRTSLMTHLVGAVIGVGGVVAIAPYHYQRYIYTVAVLTPVLAAYGWQRLLGQHQRLVGVAATTVLLLVPVTQHLSDTVHSLDYHRAYDYTHWGPDDPAVIDLFEAVRRYTDHRDVVVFFQARSMNLYTGRLAIQGNNENMMVERGDWYAQERDSDYIQTPLTTQRAAELGFDAVWSNSKFILWRIPDRHYEPIEP